MRGFAGADYEGPTPPWMLLRRCRVRTKNGAGPKTKFKLESAEKGRNSVTVDIEWRRVRTKN